MLSLLGMKSFIVIKSSSVQGVRSLKTCLVQTGANTVESETNNIEVKEVPAVHLQWRYSRLAEMYFLDVLREACVESLVERLEVVSCISTFIMADRFIVSGGKLKEMVIKFMKCEAEEVLRAIVKWVKEKHK